MNNNEIKLIPRKVISDSRGYFLKVIDGKEENNPFPCEVYITSAKPGESKGGHYHNRANEWFTLISGKARLELIDVVTKEKLTYYLTEKKPQTVYVPAGIAHEFFNDGDIDFILLAYTDQRYLPEDTIAFH